MKRLVFMCMFGIVASAALADYSIDWYTIDGGGGTSTGGPYILTGTIGQHDASHSQSEVFIVMGGFWPSGPTCIVNLEHFASFAEYWLMTGPGLPADLYDDGGQTVNIDDLGVFLDYWLYACPYDWPLE
jgi:hypothetical protein